MRSSSIVLLIGLAMLVNQTYAWWPYYSGWGAYGGLAYGGWTGLGLGYGWGGYAYPYYYGKRSVQDVQNPDRVECMFLRSKNVLSCQNGMVECETMPQMNDISQKFDLFGIEFTTETNQFNLYPKNFTSTFADSRFTLDSGKTIRFGIFASNDMDSFRGLMVKDQSCFDNLARLFSAVKAPTLTEITTGERTTKASIAGFVL